MSKKNSTKLCPKCADHMDKTSNVFHGGWLCPNPNCKHWIDDPALRRRMVVTETAQYQPPLFPDHAATDDIPF